MLTRSGSIGFFLNLLVACGTPTAAPETPMVPVAPPAHQVDEPPVDEPSRVPSPASIRTVEVEEPSHPLPEGAPAALAYFPSDFNVSQPYELVIFLHGWSGCVNVLMRGDEPACMEGDENRAGWNLGEILSAPQRILLMPQLAFRRRDGDAGRFTEALFTREWFDAALSDLGLGAPRRTILMPHSAGFETALAWAQSGLAIDAILLMDALYAKAPEFYAWAAADETRVLISFYTSGSTGRQSRRLARMAQRDGLESRIRRVHTDARHALVPSVEGPRALRELLDDAHRVGSIGTSD